MWLEKQAGARETGILALLQRSVIVCREVRMLRST
jgi:hypothetical protein